MRKPWPARRRASFAEKEWRRHLASLELHGAPPDLAAALLVEGTLLLALEDAGAPAVIAALDAAARSFAPRPLHIVTAA